MTTAVATQPKRARLEARATEETKALIEHAAALSGLSVSDFLIQSAQERAEEMIERRTRVRLSVERSIAFAEEYLNPPPPTEEMRQLAADYWAWVSNVERE
jgi:uncharacterized protein (DUF1778 family)